MLEAIVLTLLTTQPQTPTQPQTRPLELTHIRATYGMLGPARPDFNIPLGDTLHVCFDIEGLQPDDRGRLRFATTLEVADGKGNVIFKPDRADTVQLNVLASGKVPHAVRVTTGLDQPPDRYRLKVTIADVLTKKESAFTREFTVAPLDLSIVRFQLAYDGSAQVAAPCVGVVGQSLYVNFVVVGIKPDPKNENLGALSVEMSLLDDKGKAVASRPLTGDFRNIPPDVKFVPLRFDLPVHRPGQFRIALKATDQVVKKTATLTVPFLAVEQK